MTKSKVRVTVRSVRSLRLLGSTAVRASCEVTLRLNREIVRGSVAMRGCDDGDGEIEFDTYILSPEIEAALQPLYEICEDLGQNAANDIFEAACGAC